MAMNLPFGGTCPDYGSYCSRIMGLQTGLLVLVGVAAVGLLCWVVLSRPQR